MTDNTKKIIEKIDKVVVDRSDWNMACKDRLDFGFDSIYFRYAELCDELAMYKSTIEHTSPLDERRRMDYRK